MKFRHKKIIAFAKGYRGRGKSCYRTAVARVQRGWRNQYMSRKMFKRDSRRNWQLQINAGSRALGVSYSHLVHCLPLSGIMLDRKLLAELARTEPYSFKAVVETVKATGLKTWQEKRDAQLENNHERNMRHREVQLGRAKPPYPFRDGSQAERLRDIVENEASRRERELTERRASAKAAVREVIESEPTGEPWAGAYEEFMQHVADVERPLTKQEIQERRAAKAAQADADGERA